MALNHEQGFSESDLIKEIPDREEKIKEFDLESGLEEVLNLITDALDGKKNIAVAFSVSGANVGKSYLSKKICARLYEVGITSQIYHGTEELVREKLPNQQVYIFDQLVWDFVHPNKLAEIKSVYEAGLLEKLSNSGVDIDGGIIWVGIYRPDQPFRNAPIADILIRNDDAKDK